MKLRSILFTVLIFGNALAQVSVQNSTLTLENSNLTSTVARINVNLTSTASPNLSSNSTSIIRPDSLSTTTEKVEYIGPIRKCKKGTDSELNECFKLIIKDLKPKLANGIKEIELPPLDPLDLERLDFVQGTGNIVIKAVFTNIKIKGLSNFTRADFSLNSKEKKLNFVLNAPRVRIDGKYTLGGNIIFIPIGGTGPYWFDVANVAINGFCKLKKMKSENGTYVVVDKVHLDMEIEDIKIELSNLFNGNQVLGPVINRVLNEEGQNLFQEIKPELSKKIGEIVASIANAVIRNLTFLADYLE